jgi:hypothetical protein
MFPDRHLDLDQTGPCLAAVTAVAQAGFESCALVIFIDFYAAHMLSGRMLNFTSVLVALQAAIAVVAAREHALTALLVAVWGRIGRIRTRLERLIALWRAGKLPKARISRGRVPGTPASKPVLVFPATPAWLLVAVREAAPFGARLEDLLSEAECKEFLAAAPQARRLLRPLCRMLGVGVPAPRIGRVRAVWQAPKSAPAPAVPQAGLVIGPGGRLMYV